MRITLKTLLLLPALCGIMLGLYFSLERYRVLDYTSATQFWSWFVLDLTLMIMTAVCLVACYTTLRKEDRVAMQSGWRSAVFRSTLFLAPFAAGLNVVIGTSGTQTSRTAMRVFDIYAGMPTYGIDRLDLITIAGHTVLTATIGITAIAVCSKLDGSRKLAGDYANMD